MRMFRAEISSNIMKGWASNAPGAGEDAISESTRTTSTEAAAVSRVEVRLLGRFEVAVDGSTLDPAGFSRRDAANLVKLLALTPSHRLHREQAIDALWPDSPPDAVANRLHKAAHFVRRATGRADAIVLESDTVALFPYAQLTVDALVFEATAGAAASVRHPAMAGAAIESALAAYAGELLPFDPYEDWASGPRQRLQVLHRDLLRQAGRFEQLVAIDPTDEEAHVAIMRARLDTGDRAGARRQYDLLARTLEAELGVEPGPQARALRDQALEGGGTAEPAPRTSARSEAPGRESPGAKRSMELLERDDPLGALARSLDAAAGGHGSTVLIAGEPGIGKTALVSQFMEGHGAHARFLKGSCDDLSVPRPLGPIRDLATAGELAAALAAETPPHRIHGLLLDELAAAPGPTVLVLEDVHWADDATIDAITVIGRRIADLPALLVLTYRSGEVEPGHPLFAALDAIRGGSEYLHLEPLSRSAVATLADGLDDTEQIFEATGGNPFYVTELIASRPGGMPPSVAGAVVGRASRLPVASRRLVELVSMAPTRMPTWMLDAIMPEWASTAEEPERRELLTLDPHAVRFRHELARSAIRSSVPSARRRRLHGDILRALLGADADPAEILHHAAEAGDVQAIVEHAPIAARRASSVASYREAYSHLRMAIEFAGRYPPTERGALFEELAWIAYVLGRLDEAFAAIDEAIAMTDVTGDRMALGRCTRIRSRIHWYAGDGAAARHEAEAAVGILEPLGPSVELARSYGVLAQLATLAAHDEEAFRWGERALELAAAVDADDVRPHVLVSIGMARTHRSIDDTAALFDGVDAAIAAGEHHEAVRGMVGLAYGNLIAARPEASLEFCERGRRYAESHQVDTLHAYLNVVLAWLRLRAGEWDEAERGARAEVESDVSVSPLLAQTVLTELAVRRGDPDIDARLADLADAADRTAELQRIGPVLALQVERALTGDLPMPLERIRRLPDLAGAESLRSGTEAARVAAWSAVAGHRMAFTAEAPPPYAAMQAGDFATAADRFGAVGWDYERALMLSLLDDAAALSEALDTAHRLGAGPLEQRLLNRMRRSGIERRTSRSRG